MVIIETLFVTYIVVSLIIYVMGFLLSLMQLADYYTSDGILFEEGLGFCILNEEGKIKYSLTKSFVSSFLWFRYIINLITL